MRKLKLQFKFEFQRLLFPSYLLPQQTHNLKPFTSHNNNNINIKFTHFNPFTSPFFTPHFSPLSYSTLPGSGSSHHASDTKYESEDELEIEDWEEEDDSEPVIGDGGAGGGIVLQSVSWGEQALSLAREVLLQFGDDIKLYSFKTTPHGYIYVRLDKLSTKYGCPSMEEIESYSRQYKERLEEEGSKGLMPDDLALEVSSPGADRLLRVPDDMDRFRDFPMVVTYVEEDTEPKSQEKSAVFFLDTIELESENCVWKLADVKENRDPASKGKPLNRKQKDWRLKVPYSMLTRVALYLEF